MNTQTRKAISPETQVMWNALRSAVAKALERKRRLGHYAVIWSGDAPVAVGDDAPAELKNQAPIK